MAFPPSRLRDFYWDQAYHFLAVRLVSVSKKSPK